MGFVTKYMQKLREVMLGGYGNVLPYHSVVVELFDEGKEGSHL